METSAQHFSSKWCGLNLNHLCKTGVEGYASMAQLVRDLDKYTMGN